MTSSGLAKYKASHLKRLASLIGLPTTGTKPELEAQIRRCVLNPSPVSRRVRFVSIDMGIRNLGICVLEVPDVVQSRTEREHPPYKVVAWKKVDVLGRLSSQVVTPNSVVASAACSRRGRTPQTARKSEVNVAASTPSHLSKAALTLANEIVHTYSPDHILIERQRFRSGGAAAVQEWTLRVNMLESMLWACLETMRDQHDDGRHAFPDVHEVSPARVARFWCSNGRREMSQDLLAGGVRLGIDDSNTREAAKKRIDKSDKIAVVRSWLKQNVSRGVPADDGLEVTLDFSDEARAVADAFIGETRKGRSKRSTGNETGDILPSGTGKLDDLADCLLQAVAFTRWEENRRRMRESFEFADGAKG